ncbi:MAG: glycoside hydrolase family 16 protein [Christensenellaceae bacterium]|nr:glycoside hydrolase family 16 protein [Christensenellaceae bacterium]
MSRLRNFLILSLSIVLTFVFIACSGSLKSGTSNLNEPRFQEYLALPDLTGAGLGYSNANEHGWYEVFTDDFNASELDTSIWAYSPQSYRTKTQNAKHPEYTSYWCPDMVTINNGNLEIRAVQDDNYACSSDPSNPHPGRFTGGIETRFAIRDENGEIKTQSTIFEQAFGYFESRVKFPNEEGLWSAFWLQSDTQGHVGHNGEDGTEIDVYESAFIKHPSYMGHALLWDGYGEHQGLSDYRNDFSAISKNFYDDYHTFALKWTPYCYVFYTDGIPTWVSDDGGVSKVKQFLRLTVEIDEGDGWGPHAQKIGKFKSTGSVFLVDYVKVYQNLNYSEFEKTIDDFK